jgi:hypothetical protein
LGFKDSTAFQQLLATPATVIPTHHQSDISPLFHLPVPGCSFTYTLIYPRSFLHGVSCRDSFPEGSKVAVDMLILQVSDLEKSVIALVPAKNSAET